MGDKRGSGRQKVAGTATSWIQAENPRELAPAGLAKALLTYSVMNQVLVSLCSLALIFASVCLLQSLMQPGRRRSPRRSS